LESYRGVEERSWYGYPTREPEYRYRAPEYGYRTPEYERYRYEYEPRRESSRETRFLTAEEFEERLRRFFMEQESEKRMSELASFVYRELPDRMRMEIDKRVSEAVNPIKEMLSEIKSSIEEMSTRKPQEEPRKTLTAEDLERILAKERDIQQKEFDKRLLEMELKYNRELSEREKVQLQNQIKELNKQIEELSRELREAKTGRTAYDLAHEMIQAGKEIIKEDKPIRGVVREALGRPAQEKPPKRKESKASELSPEELESLGIPYESESEGEGE
jgi:histone H3/H4